MSFIRDVFPQDGAPQARPGTLCVSPEGDILVPGTPAFYERIGYRNPDFDLGDYAVRNMGFVSVSRVAPTRLKLRFRPALLTGRGVEAICRYLVLQGADEIEINYLRDEWTTEVWPNNSGVLQRLAELCTRPEGGSGARPDSPFEVKSLAITDASKDYSNPLKPLFQKWRTSFQTFDETTLSFLSRFGFMPRLVLVTAANAADTPRFQFIGLGLRLYDEKTMMELVGQPIDQQPDKKLGAWINAQYRSLLDTNKPRLDSVQVAVTQTTSDKRHVGYDRLMLPWRAQNGTLLITVTSVRTSMGVDNPANENQTGAGLPPTGPGPGARRTRLREVESAGAARVCLGGNLEGGQRLLDEALDHLQQLARMLARERELEVAPRRARIFDRELDVGIAVGLRYAHLDKLALDGAGQPLRTPGGVGEGARDLRQLAADAMTAVVRPDPCRAAEVHRAGDLVGRRAVDDAFALRAAVAVEQLDGVVGETGVRPAIDARGLRQDGLVVLVDAGDPEAIVGRKVVQGGIIRGGQRIPAARGGLAPVQLHQLLVVVADRQSYPAIAVILIHFQKELRQQRYRAVLDGDAVRKTNLHGLNETHDRLPSRLKGAGSRRLRIGLIYSLSGAGTASAAPASALPLLQKAIAFCPTD